MSELTLRQDLLRDKCRSKGQWDSSVRSGRSKTLARSRRSGVCLRVTATRPQAGGEIGSVYSSRQGLDNIWVPTFAPLVRRSQRHHGRPARRRPVQHWEALEGIRGDICQLLGIEGESRSVWVWRERSLQSTNLIDGRVKNYGRMWAASTTAAAASIECKSGLMGHVRRNILKSLEPRLVSAMPIANDETAESRSMNSLEHVVLPMSDQDCCTLTSFQIEMFPIWNDFQFQKTFRKNMKVFICLLLWSFFVWKIRFFILSLYFFNISKHRSLKKSEFWQ